MKISKQQLEALVTEAVEALIKEKEVQQPATMPQYVGVAVDRSKAALAPLYEMLPGHTLDKLVDTSMKYAHSYGTAGDDISYRSKKRQLSRTMTNFAFSNKQLVRYGMYVENAKNAIRTWQKFMDLVFQNSSKAQKK